MLGIAFVILVFLIIVTGELIKSNYSIDDTNYMRLGRQTAKTRCVFPPHPEHGRWELLNGEAKPGDIALVASVVIFKCNAGYKLSSKIPLVCINDWFSEIPQCDELCPPLFSTKTYNVKCNDKVGKEVNCTEAAHGTTLEYSCKTFYETPFGYKKTLFCENGKWDSSRPVCRPVCGKKITSDTETLLYGSKSNKKIEHPWIAAIYKKMGDSYENICGGSILSQTMILTAAHCVTNDLGNVLPKENYKVGVGKLYRSYRAAEDKRAQYLELSNIIVPEEYKADIRKFAADIAVLVIKGEITLNELVQPVCFTNMKNIHLHSGNKGEISGWGHSEGGVPSEFLRTLVIPYKYERICADELPSDWADQYNLRDKICAGFVNKSMGVCTGDSGGGLAFKYGEDNRYYIHGIASLTHLVNNTCNIQQNALYTSVAFYYDFIDRFLTRYTPKSKNCVLPPYPENGIYYTDRNNSKPGDIVSSDTILKFDCPDKETYHLSSTKDLQCSEANDMPICEKKCSELKPLRAQSIECFNKEKVFSDCHNIVDGWRMQYYCPIGFWRSGDIDNRYCVKGSWGLPKPKCVRVCGQNNVSGGGLEHPWNVGIYKFNIAKEKYEYVCGGSLVAQHIIVTAAQCVTDELGDPLPVNDFSVAAGKLHRKYDDARDTEAQFANITFFEVHPEYINIKKLNRNIAFVITSTKFVFNNFVQQICLIEFDGYSWNTGKESMVVGWRFTENVAPEEVESLEVVDLSKSDCKVPLDNSSIHTFLSDKMCARFKNESTRLLPEDRGKGLITKNSENGAYYLYGTVTSYEFDGSQNHFWSTEILPYTEYIYNLYLYLNIFDT